MKPNEHDQECGCHECRSWSAYYLGRELPCVHEWFQGKCIHCEIHAKEFRSFPKGRENKLVIEDALLAIERNTLISKIQEFAEQDVARLSELLSETKQELSKLKYAIRATPCPSHPKGGFYKCRFSKNPAAASWWSCACPLHSLLGDDLSKKSTIDSAIATEPAQPKLTPEKAAEILST